MPIKFRCHHCQQLLGISRSRAGALVDCPQCGRSLRVPSLDGTTRAVPNPGESVRRDGDLLAALSELSELATSTDDDSGNTSDRTEHDSRLRPVPSEPLPNAEIISLPEPAITVPPTSDSDHDTDFDESIATTYAREPLRELAESFDQAVGQPSLSELGFEQTPARTLPGATWWLISGILMLACLAGGWWIGRNGADGSRRSTDAELSNSGDGSAAGAAASRPRNPVAVASVRGTVMYVDPSGRSVPDSSALLILLPTSRRGDMLLSSRSLRRETEHPDFQATAAALAILGGAIAVADGDGRFQLDATGHGSHILVAVSRHIERPNDLPVPPAVEKALSGYFDSIGHAPGRLAAQAVDVAIDDTTTVDVNLKDFAAGVGSGE
ncbi:MAG: zinc ribbon domain-containing protein [Planctomycetaceae bacterium]